MMCSICLEDIDDDASGNMAKATLSCTHSFHCACILRVARSDVPHHGLCPLCRAAQDDPPQNVCKLTNYEVDSVLVDRAIRLGDSASPSLRRLQRKLAAARADALRRAQALDDFCSDTIRAALVRQGNLLADARRRADDRQVLVKRAIAGHMRRTMNDQVRLGPRNPHSPMAHGSSTYT